MKFIRNYWLGIFSTLVIVIVGYFLNGIFKRFYFNALMAYGELAGQTFVYALIPFFVLNFSRMRPELKRLQFYLFCFAVTFILCSVYSVSMLGRQIIQFENSIHEFARIGQEAIKGSHPTMGVYSYEKFGEFSKVFPLYERFFQVSEKINSEIDSNATALAAMFNSKNLSNEKNIFQAIELTSLIDSKFDLLEKALIEELNIFESRLNKIFSANKLLHRGFLKGFTEGKNEKMVIYKEIFKIAKETVQKIEGMLFFLSVKSGSFWDSDETFIFENEEDSNTFQLLGQNLYEHTQKLELMLEELLKNTELTLKNLNKI